jgi:hypothetical protein
MISPIRRLNDHSPRRLKHHISKEDNPENIADTFFDLIDHNPSKSLWYSIRVPGTLPSKRSFHASVVFNNM